MSSSFKQMIKDGEIKRADAMKVRIEDIHEEPGFNLRREGEDLQASIDALATHIRSGGMVPPLEVRPREAGGVFVVDGHRRRRAYLQVAEDIRDANGETWIPVVAFVGNDAERVARIMTSAEGRSLSSLEVAEGYRRLVAFGWSADEIARKVGKTRQHVDQLLILANANSDVQAMVARGEVSATSAIDTVRKHGEQAGEKLGAAVNAAKAGGKGKATAGAIKGKPLPSKLVDEMAAAHDALIGSLSTEARATIETLHLSDSGAPTMIEVPAVTLLELIAIAEVVKDTRQKQAERGRAKEAAAPQVAMHSPRAT